MRLLIRRFRVRFPGDPPLLLQVRSYFLDSGFFGPMTKPQESRASSEKTGGPALGPDSSPGCPEASGEDGRIRVVSIADSPGASTTLNDSQRRRRQRGFRGVRIDYELENLSWTRPHDEGFHRTRAHLHPEADGFDTVVIKAFFSPESCLRLAKTLRNLPFLR
jgi:hypothetical protein